MVSVPSPKKRHPREIDAGPLHGKGVSSTTLPKAGDIIAGRYRIDEQLGRGGMGAVYRATQLGLLRAVAVKVQLPERNGARVRERFEREARVAIVLGSCGPLVEFGLEPCSVSGEPLIEEREFLLQLLRCRAP